VENIRPNQENFFKKLNFKIEIKNKDVLQNKEIRTIDILGGKNDNPILRE
jgi:hypothetical protein